MNGTLWEEGAKALYSSGVLRACFSSLFIRVFSQRWGENTTSEKSVLFFFVVVVDLIAQTKREHSKFSGKNRGKKSILLKDGDIDIGWQNQCLVFLSHGIMDLISSHAQNQPPHLRWLLRIYLFMRNLAPSIMVNHKALSPYPFFPLIGKHWSRAFILSLHLKFWKSIMNDGS